MTGLDSYSSFRADADGVCLEIDGLRADGRQLTRKYGSTEVSPQKKLASDCRGGYDYPENK